MTCIAGLTSVAALAMCERGQDLSKATFSG